MLKLIRKAIDEGVEALEEIDAKMKHLAEVKEQLKDEPPPLEISEPDMSNKEKVDNLTPEIP